MDNADDAVTMSVKVSGATLCGGESCKWNGFNLFTRPPETGRGIKVTGFLSSLFPFRSIIGLGTGNFAETYDCIFLGPSPGDKVKEIMSLLPWVG